MKKLCSSAIAVLLSSILIAQEKATDVDININKDKGGSSIWGSPILWVVGAAVFIILLVAVSRSGSRQN
jgi:hypothetical protein